MSLKLFKRCARTFFIIGLRALTNNHGMCLVGPLVLDTMGRINIWDSFVGLD